MYCAGDGRESPLKYTKRRRANLPNVAGDGRESPLKYTTAGGLSGVAAAGDGRESPLKYTVRRQNRCLVNLLGMVENRRSSTLCCRSDSAGDGRNRRSSTLADSFRQRWGWSRIAAQVHCTGRCWYTPQSALGMVENRRSSTLGRL